MEVNSNTVYVAWNIPVEDGLKELQTSICNKYNLTPRKEMHITLGFIGYATTEQIKDLANEVQKKSIVIGSSFKLIGVGGAAISENAITLLNDATRSIDTDHPRVIWASIRLTNNLKNLRKSLSKAVGNVGLNNSKITNPYAPHITLGSGGPKGEDWSQWDTPLVDKRKVFLDYKKSMIVFADKLHITDISNQPDSLSIISSFYGEAG